MEEEKEFGEIAFPTDAASGQVVLDSTAATAYEASADEIEWAVVTIEEGEKRKLSNVSFGFGWDPVANIPKVTFNYQKTPTSKIVKWVKGKGRR